jgi:hypothetical protein
MLCVFSSVVTAAQVKIVPRAGAAISSTTWSQSQIQTESRTAPALAVGLEFNVIGKFKLLMEGGFVSKGHKYSVDRSLGAGVRLLSEHTYEHNYAVFPLLIKRHFGTKAIAFYANLGPYLGFGLGGKHHGESSVYDNGLLFERETFKGRIAYGTVPKEGDVYYSDRLDYGLTAGGGILFFKRVAIDLKYEIGFVDLMDERAYQNRSLQISLAWPISLNAGGREN